MPTFESVAAGAATETGTTLPAPYPATVNSGDLLYLYAWRKTNATQHTFTTPDGWTELTTAASAWGGRHSLWHRTADGTETGSVSITTSDLSGGQGGRAFMARVSDTAGHDTGVYSFAGQANTPEMVIATGITPSEDNCLVLTGVGIATTSATVPNLTPPAGYTERLDVGTGWITTLGLGTLLQTTATATGALTWDTDAQNVTNGGGGFIVAALPAETGPALTSPTYVAFGTTTVTPRVTTDTDNGTIYHVVTLESESPPGRTQVEAGNNASNVAAIAAADQPVTESGVIDFAQVTGLNPGTAYRISYAHRGTPAEEA